MLRQHCENPACETSVEIAGDEIVPDGWWMLEQNVDADEDVAYLLCSLFCVSAAAAVFAADVEPEDPDGR